MNLTRQVEKNQGKFKTQKRLLQGSRVRGWGVIDDGHWGRYVL